MLISMEICAEDLELLMETGFGTLNCISFCRKLVPEITKTVVVLQAGQCQIHQNAVEIRP
jgi:hypothetical protein